MVLNMEPLDWESSPLATRPVHPINYANLHFSVIKDNSSVFFYLKPHIVWTKISYGSEIFALLSGWVKIHQIPHVIFRTKSQFFF